MKTKTTRLYKAVNDFLKADNSVGFSNSYGGAMEGAFLELKQAFQAEKKEMEAPEKKEGKDATKQ